MAGKIAILLDDGFEDLEFFYPYLRVQEENFEPVVLGIEPKVAKGKNGLSFEIKEVLSQHDPDEFVGLYIPGGHAPDNLRRYDVVKQFVSDFYKQGRPIGTICHGPQVLISAKVVNGVKMTSVSSIKDDLENAGAIWVNEPVVVDKRIVSSRVPKDLP
jgi:protease I